MANKKVKKGNLIGLVVAVGAVSSMLFIDWSGEPEPESIPVRPLKTLQVKANVTEDQFVYLGKVVASQEVKVSFDVSGSLTELLVNKGDKVQKGQLLARLDSRDFENAVAVAEAEALEAEIRLNRLRPVANSGAISKQDLTAAERAYAATQANLRIKQKALADASLYAPFSGVIADVVVENFENVTAQQHVFTLQDESEVHVTVDVPESRIARLNPDQIEASSSRFIATLDYFPEREFPVSVYEFKTKADEVTMTYQATLTMPRPDGVVLLSGMPVTVTEFSPRSDVSGSGISLPLDVVPVDPEGRYFVWKLQPDGGGVYSVHRSFVQVGEMVGDEILITGGVAAGDVLAAVGVHVLQEGQQVRLFDDKGE